MKIFYKFIILCIAACLLNACKHHLKTDVYGIYGAKANPDRLKKGIFPLPDDTVVYRKSDEITPLWANTENFKKNRWQLKELEIRNGTPVRETDIFYSGNEYKTGEDNADEQMTLSYWYSKEAKGQNPWECLVVFGPDQGRHSIEEAYEILRKWGIEYPRGEK